MIIQPTAEQTRRINRKRTYSGPGFGPRSFECIGIGIGIGLGDGPSPPPNAAPPLPASILTWAWTIDMAQPGTLVSGKLHTAPDQSGNGVNLTAATADLTYSAAGGPNSQPYCQTNTTSNYLTNAAYVTPVPGTTPTFHYGIYRVDTWVLNSGFRSGSTSSRTAVIGSSAGKFRAFNGVSGPEVAVTAGTWVRLFCQFNNSATNDRLRIGAADSGVGTALGNSASIAGLFLLVGSAFSAMSCCWAGDALTVATAPQIAALDTWAAWRFGAISL